jgi:hypothetical protein
MVGVMLRILARRVFRDSERVVLNLKGGETRGGTRKMRDRTREREEHEEGRRRDEGGAREGRVNPWKGYWGRGERGRDAGRNK